MLQPELVFAVDLGLGQGKRVGLDLRSDRPLHRDQRRLPLLMLFTEGENTPQGVRGCETPRLCHESRA